MFKFGTPLYFPSVRQTSFHNICLFFDFVLQKFKSFSWLCVKKLEFFILMMSHCMSAQDYPCSNRNKCRNSKRCEIHERPERDTQRGIPNKPSNNFTPPKSPGPDWELQYCKWSGWTYVKKKEEVSQKSKPEIQEPEPKKSQSSHIPEDRKKKKGGFFNCFGKKSNGETSKAVQATPSRSAQFPSRADNEPKAMKQDEFDDCCCCGVDYDCCCSVCPCMAQCCCCMCQQESPQECKPECKAECRSTETQTFKEMKEQATKMSEIHLPKQPQQQRQCCCGRRRKCGCRRRVCCPCMRNTCCPCVQPKCCPCNNNNNNEKKETSPKKKSPSNKEPNFNTENLINFCLTNNLRKQPSYSNDIKPNNFSLHKSLDLLLKNNINIMNLFQGTKELHRDVGPVFSNQTISCLSSDNFVKKTDPEHTTLLTAVCDAILSSHKFDERLSPKSHITSRTNFKYSDSRESFSNFASKDILGRILSDLNFTSSKSRDDLNIPKEINVPAAKTLGHPKRSLTKLIRNKSRILAAPKFPKKMEALRKLDLLKANRDDIRMKRRICKKGKVEESKLSLTDLFKSDHHVDQKVCSSSNDRNLESVDALLNSLDLLGSSANTDLKTQNERSRYDTLILDATSPPFTDLDLLLNLDDERQEVEQKDQKES